MSPVTLVTGAGGYLGRLMSTTLDEAGHDLVLVDRSFPTQFSERMARHDLRRIDAAVLADITEVSSLDYVIHAAAVTADPGRSGTAVITYLREHVLAGMAMLALAARHGARFVFVSSAGVFAPEQSGELHEGVVPLGEGAYVSAKRMLEIATLEAARAGADAIVVRLGNLYGGDERPGTARPRVSVVQRLVDEALSEGGIRLEGANEVREWTYAPDIAAIMPKLFQTPIEGERMLHLANPETISRSDIVQEIARRVDSVSVEVVSEASPAIRGPLVSRNPLTSSLVPPEGWTPFEQGLAALLAGSSTNACTERSAKL